MPQFAGRVATVRRLPPTHSRDPQRGRRGEVGAQQGRRELALIAAVSLLILLGAGPAAASTPQRPLPPRSSDLAAPAPGASSAQAPLPPPARLPLGGTQLFPGHRVVSYWGAPALPQTALGKRSPRRAARRLMQAVRRYALTGERPVVPAIDLVVTLATRDRGRRGKYSARLTRRVIRRYLDAARRIGGRLIIDIQPGRSSLLRELKWHRRWLLEPDVDVAFDPEWNVGRRGVPGQTTGYVRAKTINASSAWLADLVRANGLPQKALIVHHFRDGSITRRPELVQPGAPVALTLNFDGIGSPAAKVAGYERLQQDTRLYNGFSLFYKLEAPLMPPLDVLALAPESHYVMYQ